MYQGRSKLWRHSVKLTETNSLILRFACSQRNMLLHRYTLCRQRQLAPADSHVYLFSTPWSVLSDTTLVSVNWSLWEYSRRKKTGECYKSGLPHHPHPERRLFKHWLVYYSLCSKLYARFHQIIIINNTNEFNLSSVLQDFLGIHSQLWDNCENFLYKRHCIVIW